ncbi:MAG: type II secretion system protein N, partial [Pseudomonadales bacterium]
MLGKLNKQLEGGSVALVSILTTDRACVFLAWLFSLASLTVLLSIIFLLIRPPVEINTSGLVESPRIDNFRWNWFSTPQPEQAQQSQELGISEENLANASIRAELLGVVISPRGSYAAISTSANPDGVYGIGDSIENNVTLEAIEPTRVIISQQGSRRQIPLNSITEAGGSAQRADQSGLLELNESQAGPEQGFNLSGLLSAAPEMVPGVGMGLRLGSLSADLADLADVQEGDVLISVNGSAVSDMMSNPVMWQQFSQMTSMPVTIMRDGEQIELFVNGASLSEKILPQLGAGR